MIKNIVFDMGGVIIDLCKEESVRRFERLGVKDANNLLDPYKQSGIFLKLEHGDLNAEEFAVELSKEIGHHISERQIMDAIHGFVADVDERKLELMERLMSDYKLYILSNNNPYMMKWVNSPWFISQGRPLNDFVHQMFLSYEMKLCKPEKEIFQQMIQETGLKPQESLFIDDAPKNIETGKELGFICYKATNKEDWREDILKILDRKDLLKTL